MQKFTFKLLYIVSMAVCFTTKLNGQNLNYYIKIWIGLVWIGIWLLDTIHRYHAIRYKKLLRWYIVPWALIALWSIVLWTLIPPEGYNVRYLFRMLSNTVMIMIAITNAYVGAYYFGIESIPMALASVVLIIFLNLVMVIPQYGIANFLLYLKDVVGGNFPYHSSLWYLASDLEIQGPTMVLGIFLIYFMWFDQQSVKAFQKGGNLKKIFILLIIVFCLYIGFKRTVVLGVFAVFCLLSILKSRRFNLHSIANISGFSMCIISIWYVAAAKLNLLEKITAAFNIDTLGRTNIYKQASELFVLDLLYLGKGFCYVSKYMYDKIGFAVHSEAIRMYAEIGAIPYIMWNIYYLICMPKKVMLNYGEESGRACMAVTIYVFATYLVENTLVMYAMQYCLALFVFVNIFSDKRGETG